MVRIAVIAAVLIVAAIAVWHPAPPAAPLVQAATSPPASHGSPKRREGSSPAPLVYVVGAVFRPGLYRVASGARVNDAVRLAGGLRPDADPVAVNLASHVTDGDEVAVPRIGDAPAAKHRATRAARRARSTKRRTAPATIVDVNTADAQALATVPGIGASIASRIVLLRESDGAYATLDQLLDVAGMTPARLDRARPYLSI